MAHYTSWEDILLVVEPVVIEALHRRWATAKTKATALAGGAEIFARTFYTLSESRRFMDLGARAPMEDQKKCDT